MKDRSKFQISERHILAANNLFFMPVFLDPRATAGTMGYIHALYGDWLPLLLGTWAGIGALILLRYKVKPVTMILCLVPVLSYWVFGSWWLFSTENAPISAFFIPFSITFDIVAFIFLRIRAIAKGSHPDDTYYPEPD